MNANDCISAFYAAYDMQGDSAEIQAVHPCILSEKLTYRPAQTRAGFFAAGIHKIVTFVCTFFVFLSHPIVNMLQCI